MEAISLNKYARLLVKNWKIIIYFMIAFLVLVILYALFLYKPTYQSEAKILIKDNAPNTFIIDIGQQRQFTPASQTGNPVLTQIEVLSSMDVAKGVVNKFAKDPVFGQFDKDLLAKAFHSSVKFDNLPGTDIIRIKAKWTDPDLSQKIAQTYLDTYSQYNISINKKSVTQLKKYISKQLAKSTNDLINLRNEIKKYRETNNSIDIDRETASIIDQITNINNSIAGVDGLIHSETGKASILSRKLGIETSQAINSVALGQNSSLTTLQQNLQDAQQKYATFNARYTLNNPQMQALKENINEIKSQIQSQIIATIGKKLVKVNNSIITDPIRTSMVSDLVKNQVDIQALTGQKQSLKNTLAALQKEHGQIPDKQKNLQALLEKEKTLSEIVDTLNAKYIEAQVRESEIVSNINIVENPTLPLIPSFPNMIHIILIFEFTGMLFGIATILGLYYVEDICEGASELEKLLNAPVFGIIPWLTESSYSAIGMEYNPLSIVGIVYQKIITGIKVKCYKKKIKVIGFTSAEFEKKRSIITANISKSLAKCGNSVLIVDADFRGGNVSREFKIDTLENPDLTDLLQEIYSYNIQDNEEKIISIINKYIIPVSSHSNLYLIPNNGKMDNPYEILTSEAFPVLINVLKEKFDFILLDTPPILAVPDCIIVSQYIDALGILCGLKTPRSSLRKIKKICSESYIKILGTIARNSTTEFELPENQYIKHITSV